MCVCGVTHETILTSFSLSDNHKLMVWFLFFSLCILHIFLLLSFLYYRKFTKGSYVIHSLFIIHCYTININNKRFTDNFFIIAQMPRGVWALLISGEFFEKQRCAPQGM